MIQPVQNTMPQAYPCIPMSSYQSQAIPQNNAVKIDIHNPTAGNQQPAYNPYVMPQASVYNPYQPTCCPIYPQPVMMPYTMPQVISPIVVQAPQPKPTVIVTRPQNKPQTKPQTTTQPTVTEQKPAVIPQAVVVPQPAVTNNQVINNAPQAVPVPPAVTPAQKAEDTTKATANAIANATATVNAPQPEKKEEVKTETKPAEAKKPQVENPASTPVNVDLNQLVSKLNTTNADTQLNAIETIAETAQSGSSAATQLLDTQIIDALGNIIKRDTTQMQAPSPEQLKLRQKLIAGEKLTDEQLATANKISEMEMAERNKQFALYTVAILQKLLATEVEKAQGTKLALKDMPMINDIVKIAKADANPMLRASALASLSYIATPENKSLLATMFEQSKKDADPNVQAVAAEALNKLSQI